MAARRAARAVALLLLVEPAAGLFATRRAAPRAARLGALTGVPGNDLAATESVSAAPESVSDEAAEWLVARGIVGPAATAEQHARAKVVRKEKAAKAAVITTKRPPTRWGDAHMIRDKQANGGWAEFTHSSATRKATEIVDVGNERSRLVSHVLLATEAMALDVVALVARAGIDFGDLARNLSSCAETRVDGGNIGWIDHVADASLVTTDGVLPWAARLSVMSQLLKPGDVTVVESDRGFHVVKVDEVIHDVEFTKLRAGGEDRGWQGKTYSLITMGCQMNAADSERLEGGLLQLGMVEFEEGARRKPDVVVLNTCSIRERAEHKVYSALGPHARRKQRGEDVVIIVAGCVAQQEGERLARRVPEVDVVMGPQYAGRLLDILEKATMGQQVVATAAAYHAEALNAPRRGSEVVAWVNVAHGCNERCTYCVVPATRGVEQSREPSAILAELAGLGASGFQEATLLGQNVDAYGRDMSPKRSFHDLVVSAAETARESGLKRLRFTTSHPRYMSERVVDAVAQNSDVLMPVFHMPAQSGDDDMLRFMGRGHTVRKYLKIVDRIRSQLPDATISSDFIVGCPGETEAMFQKTLDLIQLVGFDSCMCAAYSPRPGTPMARWDGASAAFEQLGVAVDHASTVEGLRALLETRFKDLAKAHHPDAGGDSSTWGRIVEARKVAAAKLDEIERRPRGAFPPLSEIGPAQVSEEIKDDRLQRINVLTDRIAFERAQRFVGRTESVLVEQRNSRRPNQVVGRTRANKLVFFDADIEAVKGKICQVVIREAGENSLTGELVVEKATSSSELVDILE